MTQRKETNMFRIRLFGALIGALTAGLAVATIAAGNSGGSATPGSDHAFGAGTFGPGCWQTQEGPFCVPFNYTMRLLGISEGQSGRARGVFERRNNVTGGTFRGDVTCMTVDGNRAAVGGIFTLTPGTPGISEGDPFIVWVEDNGTLAGSDGNTPDQISALVALPPGDPGLAFMPDRFPSVCPGADSLSGYLPLTTGDITLADN
jgi:hypothetical protein